MTRFFLVLDLVCYLNFSEHSSHRPGSERELMLGAEPLTLRSTQLARSSGKSGLEPPCCLGSTIQACWAEAGQHSSH